MNRRKIKKALYRLSHLPGGKYFLYYSANKLKHFYLKLSKSTRVAYPSTIMLELGNHCNLHCTTCPREYAYGKAMDKGFMPLENARKIIDEVWPYLDSIGLTGMGETFLYKEIEEVVDYVKSKNKGIIISVSTNAMVPGFIEKVSKLIGKIDTIQISIDGLDAVYERIRVNASFKQLDENLKALADLCKGTSTTLMLNMVVTKENYFQMPALIQYAADTGIHYMDYSLFNLASVSDIDSTYYQFYRSEEFLQVAEQLDEAIKAHPSVIVSNRNFITGSSFQECPFPWTHFYICMDGYVTPCCAKPFPKELNFGNVFEERVIDVLNSKGFRQFRDLWHKNTAPAFCDKCNFIDKSRA